MGLGWKMVSMLKSLMDEQNKTVHDFTNKTCKKQRIQPSDQLSMDWFKGKMYRKPCVYPDIETTIKI